MKNHNKKVNSQKIKKLWGTAFRKDSQAEAISFAAGRDVKGLPPADEILIPYEIKASKAWIKGLVSQKIIDKNTYKKLDLGLTEISDLYNKGKFQLDPNKEDVHSNIEAYLIDKFGLDLGGKIHSGRSRSEQGVVDIILYLKEQNRVIKKGIIELIKTLEKKSKKYQDTIIPGYTHHQHATVTTFGRMLEAYAEALKKDLQRLKSWEEIEEISPLGSTAGYGTTLPINKKEIKKYLHLQKEFSNEIEAITFKGDAEAMMIFNLAMFMNHLSSLAQTLIIFSTKEFEFIKISDEYSTGSSIMPQKKNPDPLEVMKAKSSMCQGYLMSILSMKNAVFIGYNRDLQWSKYVVMDAINEISEAPQIMKGVINTLFVNIEKMKLGTENQLILTQAVMEGMMMDFGVPMRVAKILIEKTIKGKNAFRIFPIEILNKELKNLGLSQRITEKDLAKWTDSLRIAKKQIKKGGI